MKKVVLIVIVIVLVALGAVYFVGRKNTNSSSTANNGSSSSQMTNMPNNSSNSSSSAAQTTDQVKIANFAFSPANITVKKGTTVTWTNQDSVAHTVTESDGQDGPKSGSLDNGQSYSFTFNTAGTFKYRCAIHPNMTGTVVVSQ